MKLRPLISALLAVCLALATMPTYALATPSNLARIANEGVVAVHDPSGVRTGFAFGDAGLVIVGTSADTGVHLITASGASAVGDGASRDGELAAVHAPALHLSALRRSDVREISAGTLAYILGAPLGYEGKRIRAVVLPAIELHSTRMMVIAGALPASFQGGPVVTRAGRVIGAVAAVGATNWTLAPQVRLSTLVAAASRASGGEGVPVTSILVGVLIVIAVLGGLVAMRTRRRRENSASAAVVVRQRPATAPVQHSTQPLVRRLGPDTDTDAEPEDDDDFDIVLKSQEDR
jgi:hypothetical protein